MKQLHLSPNLSAFIQKRIDELNPQSPGDWVIRVCKEDLNALPVHANNIYLWALRPDGVVLCMDHEAFGHPTEPETDPELIYSAVLGGTRKYPELGELLLSLQNSERKF